MYSYAAAFTMALLVGLVLTPLVRRLAIRVGAVSGPAQGRHVHWGSTPRLGGIAIAASVCAPLLALFAVNSSVAARVRAQPLLTIGLLSGGLLLCAVGAADDIRGLRALAKLLFQILAATIAYACGIQIQVVALPWVGSLSMGIFAYPITVLWIVGITNAVNLIDGLDGLAAGVVFLAAFTNLVVAYLLGSVLVGLFMATLLGAILGFLVFNFNPARIFMGDSGSYFLGFVIATSSLQGDSQKTSTTVALLVPVIALGLPIFDTTFSMFRRALERRPLFSPDRGHIHHRLLDIGLTHRRAVLVLYGTSVVLTAAAIAIAMGKAWHAGLALLIVSVAVVGLVRFAGYFGYLLGRVRQRQRLYDPFTDRLRRIVPGCLTRLGAANTEDAAWAVLEEFGRDAGLSRVELVSGATTTESSVRCWRRGDLESAREPAKASYPLGEDGLAQARLKFGWASDSSDPPREGTILLQLVADETTLALIRAVSDLRPLPACPDARSAPTKQITMDGRRGGSKFA